MQCLFSIVDFCLQNFTAVCWLRFEGFADDCQSASNSAFNSKLITTFITTVSRFFLFIYSFKHTTWFHLLGNYAHFPDFQGV